LDSGGLAALIATQVGFGGMIGFLLGYGLKKMAAIILKVTALISAIFMMVLAWLSSVGVIRVNFDALTSIMDNSFNTGFAALLNSLAFIAQVLPLGGSFGLGFYIGAKKG